MSQIHFGPWTQQVTGHMRKPELILVIIIVTASLGCIGTAAAADTPPNHAKTQVLLYLVGSDLESESGTGTADLREITQSYENTDPAKLDIVVAFGGAKNPGWQGMKIATIEQLLEDAKDGKFGNSQYLYSDANADMGSGQSFTKFLNVAKTSRPADRSILILSDHGASYDGIGVDDITKNQLMMGDIDRALRDSGSAYEPIMFDACLMGSIEVAKTVQPYTRVMLGSEEIQRGSYEYTHIIKPLINNPDIDSVTLAKTLADSYVDSKTPPGKSKTMAVIDVTKVPDIRDGLNELGEKLIPISETDQGLHDLKGAYNDAIRLGVRNGETPTSVDLVSLLQNIEKKRPEVSPEVQKVLGLIRSAIIYERHNEYSQAVYGISIAAPDAMDINKYNQIGDGVKIAPQWDEFFKKIVMVSHEGASGSAAVTKVVVEGSPQTTGDDKAKIQDKFVLSTPGFVSRGNGSFELRDPYHAAKVYATYYRLNRSDAISIGLQPISPDSHGLYHVPLWDGRWYYFPDSGSVHASPWDWLFVFFSDPAKKAKPLLVDMEYEGVTVGGFTKYNSWISIQDMGDITDATLVTFVNRSTNTYEVMITPYTLTKEGNELFGVGMDRFNTGALVTSYSSGFNTRTLETGDYILSTTTAAPDMAMEYTLLPDGTYAAGILAYYDNNAEVLADQFRIITIRNGAVVNSTAGSLIQG